MPLSRGSAAVGFVVLLGLLLAANMEFTGSIPEGFQVDWEAILNSDPNSFVDSVKMIESILEHIVSSKQATFSGR
ncbi:Suppressor of RPS4-RLD 1 [Camellia lanceoleosa]|uniref:Suppressor of RPS4-RLD 1 n=1 Tax=Camellia lanceoleosa TaxID=1840588 RepID=A0ACC0I5K9_9ERIC|nr:Suppressor of RPS4-RLD 1 [Camellia lanceoleosa]